MNAPSSYMQIFGAILHTFKTTLGIRIRLPESCYIQARVEELKSELADFSDSFSGSPSLGVVDLRVENWEHEYTD